MQQVPAYFYVAPLSGDTPQLREVFEQVGATSTWYGATQSDLIKGAPSSPQQRFLTNFQARYKEQPYLPDAAIAYDDIQLIKKPLEQCLKAGQAQVDPAKLDHPLLDPDCFNRLIGTITISDGVGGPIHLGEDRATHRQIYSIRVKDVEWVRVEGE